MPHPPPDPIQGFDGVSESKEVFHNLTQPFRKDRTGSFDHPVGYGEPLQQPLLNVTSNMSDYSAIDIFQEAVTKARQTMKQSLAGSEEVGGAVNLKLSIDLKSSGLQEFPEEVVEIVKSDVESLKLDYNQISHIPLRFEECHTLKYLNLRSNRLKDFPKALYRLPRLEVLDLSRNKLSRIPEEIKAMRALRVLSLGNNLLEDLPFVIASLDIRILKLAGNPLNPELMRIVEGVAVSPSRAALPDNEKEVIMTRKLKKYLKVAETAARDFDGDSSSDGTVSTPRAPRRTLSHRFPVKPNNSESESASDIHLTIRSPGFTKPPIPVRSDYRKTSGQHDGILNAALHRPGLAPLSSGNERNRSNSESVLQATQYNRSKRMGIVTKKQSDVGIRNEAANRNSFHLRGQSDGSALSDRYNKVIRTSEAMPANPARNDRQQGLFIRRLSSLPEQKRDSVAPDRAVEGAKGVLYSLHLVHPHLSTIIPVVKDKSTKDKSTLEKVYKYASNNFKVLDSTLHELDNKAMKHPEGKYSHNKKFLSACEAIMSTYQEMGNLLLSTISQLVAGGDQRYIRTLILLLYGNVTEGRNAMWSLISSIVNEKPSANHRTQFLPIKKELYQNRDRSLTPTKQRPNPQKYTKAPITYFPSSPVGIFAPASGVQTALPLHINGRSRSNSRTGPLVYSNISSMATTPRSGESFLVSGAGTPKLRSRSNSALGHHVMNAIEMAEGPDHEALFEKIFIALSRCVVLTQTKVPTCLEQFSRCLDIAQMSVTSQRINLLWSTLISRCTVCLETSAAMQKRISTIKLHEHDVRHSRGFWRLASRLCLSLEKLMSGIREARYLDLISTDLLKVIHPLQKSFSETGRFLKSSPWEPLTREKSESASRQQQQDGSHRYRTRTGSGNSPYSNVPATPLSAALGPAAQATVPTPAGIDRSFAGDVFQRADELLRVQQTMVHRR